MEQDHNRYVERRSSGVQVSGTGVSRSKRSVAGRRARSRRRRRRRNWPYLIGILLCLLIMAAALWFAGKKIYGIWQERSGGDATATGEISDIVTEPPAEETTTASSLDLLLGEAAHMAMQYDYDGAITLLNNSDEAQNEQVQEKIQEYEGIKTTLVEQDITEITHVFFHILVEDPARTFLDTSQGRGYNSVMTTVTEFEKILQQMYDRGFVLVGLHDMAELQTDAEGNVHMVKNPIMLPEGKKAFVMSQDDVCYYEYMEGSGCATRILLDEAGKPTCEYTDAEGNVMTGEYDLVPILDRFVEEHPDFSYRGAKAVLAFTGYNGILGYRTDETYDAASEHYDPEKEANPNIEADRTYVKQLTQVLKEDGYEFASHSWGHRDYGDITFDHMKLDADKWERNVEPLLPDPCDIILFPFGADIGDWRPYAADNERLQYLQSLGFYYYCNVDSAQYWVQLGDTYLRQGRRNLDGYRLWMDYGGGDNRLSDLMDVKEVFDTRRPTPITWN